MSVEEEHKNREVIGTIENDVDDLVNVIQENNLRFKIIWPFHIYPCQKIDFFGAKIYAVPYFQFSRSRMLWVVLYLILHVEPLCNIILKSKIQRSERKGYIMMYTTKTLSFLNR